VSRIGKLLRCAVFGLLLAAAIRPALAFDLQAGLGSNNFTVISSNAISYSQTATNLTLGTPFTTQSLVGGFFIGIYNWTSVSSFGLVMAAPAASPNRAFKIEFFDSDENLLNEYQGFAQDLTATPSFVPVEFAVNPGSGDMSAVKGFQFTWGGDGSGSVTLVGVAGSIGPVNPVITSTSYSSNAFTMTWSGTDSLPVTVQRRGSLETGQWTAIAQGVTLGRYTDTNPPVDRAFYRLVLP
jgi:hypothetical protein